MADKVSDQKLWGGRFTGELSTIHILTHTPRHAKKATLTCVCHVGTTDPLMHEFNQSLSYDQRMYKADIQGSQAYALALRSSGILSSEEFELINSGLQEVLAEWETSSFKSTSTDEDIHTANERRLSEKIGKVAGKLHTGRSRNDQVATDMRLWLLEETEKLLSYLQAFVLVIVSRAEKEVDVLMPGYTHLQVCGLFFV